jgi:predicted transcriptional regulator
MQLLTQIKAFQQTNGPLIVEIIVEYLPHMETIQIVLDSELRIAADQAARRNRVNRSQLVRDALREYLLRLETKVREELDRAGYRKSPSVLEEGQGWESEAAWPDQPASLRG